MLVFNFVFFHSWAKGYGLRSVKKGIDVRYGFNSMGRGKPIIIDKIGRWS